MKLTGAQVCDGDQKAIFAITTTLRLCQHAIVNAAVSIPGADIAGTPNVARFICDAALRTFGFSKIHSTDLEEIIRQIVWQSMYKIPLQDRANPCDDFYSYRLCWTIGIHPYSHELFDFYPGDGTSGCSLLLRHYPLP